MNIALGMPGGWEFWITLSIVLLLLGQRIRERRSAKRSGP